MAATVRPASASGRSRRIWIVLPGMLAALLAFAGANQLLSLRSEDLGEWASCFSGVVELVGVVGSLVPGVARFAAVWLAAVTAGAVVIPLTRLSYASPAVLGGLLALAAHVRR